MESFQRLWSDQVWILGQNCLIGLLCFPPQRHVRPLVAVFWWFQHTFWISKLIQFWISHMTLSQLWSPNLRLSYWQESIIYPTGKLYLLISCCLQINSGEHKFFSFCCLLPRLLCPWNCPDRNTRVSCHFLLEGIFLTQGSNLHLLCLLHWLPWWLRQ